MEEDLTDIFNLPFEIEEWDEVANVPPAHLSYIIAILLPKRLVDLEYTKKLELQLKDFCEKNNVANTVSVGSSSEGFNIPYTFTIEINPHIDIFSDIDLLFVQNDCPVNLHKSQSGTVAETFHASMDPDNVHPGYTRVRLHQYEDNEDVVIHDDKAFLSGQEIQKKRFNRFAEKRSKDTEKFIYIHGPAVSIEYSTLLDTENIEKHGMRVPLDIVLALPVLFWPDIANRWIQRVKKSEWLGEDLVDAIVSSGCHVVPVAHKHSCNPSLEWRISFATTEKEIAQTAITTAQRQCYIYLKLLRYVRLKDLEAISSYCLKTIFFYACERIPKSTWDLHLGQCLLYLLDSLLRCVKRRNIPSFFVPENNLLDHIPEEKLKEVESRLIQLRTDPITPILQMTDSVMIGKVDIPYVFRDNIKYILEDIEKFKRHRNIKTSAFDAFFVTSFRMCLRLLNQGKPKQAIDVLMDSYPVIDHYLGPMPLVYYLNEVALMIEDNRLGLLLLRELVDMAGEQPAFDWFKENLACWYHVVAHTYPEESQERMENLLKAEEIILEVIASDGLNSCGVTYGCILMSQKKFHEASKTLRSLVKFKEEEKSKDRFQQSITTFGKSERIFLDSELQAEILAKGKIEGPSIFFAYYFLVKCLVKQNASSSLPSLFQEFQGLYDLCQDITGFKLLGYSLLQQNEMRKAKEVFTFVLQECPEDKLIIKTFHKIIA